MRWRDAALMRGEEHRVAFVTITPKVEIEFAPGVWTDVTSYIDSESNLRWKRGVGADRRPYASTCSFTMDNSTEVFTPGNTSSAYFNKLVRGIGVRVTSLYSATTYYHFRGIVANIRPIFPNFGPARMRVAIECKGISANLSRQPVYLMGVQENLDVDTAAVAIMDAAGWSLYDFEDSDFLLPVVFPRGDPLSDLLSLWRSDPTKLLFEAGDGKLKATSCLGGYSAPDHTWGSTIVPDGDLMPDQRWESQFSRQLVTVAVLKTVASRLQPIYSFPFTTQTAFPQQLAKDDATLIVRGTFDKFPLAVGKKFNIVGYTFSDWASLYAYVSDSASAFTVQWDASLHAPDAFTLWRIDDEIMLSDIITLITATMFAPARYSITCVRGYAGTTVTFHNSNTPVRAAFPTSVGYETWGTLTSSPLTYSTTTLVLTGASGSPTAGTYFKLDNEIIRFVSGTATNWTIVRGCQGTSAAGHVFGTLIYLAKPVYPGGPTGTIVFSSLDAAGEKPVETAGTGGGPVPGIVGAGLYANAEDVYVDGNRFELAVMNVADDITYTTPTIDGQRYITALDVTGDYIDVEEKRISYSVEDPLPLQEWLEDGPGYDMPFGAPSLNVVKAFAIGLLRAGRVPSPWISTPAFIANIDASTAVDQLTAEIGDLVLWSGTGTWREKITEYYRILGIEGAVGGDGLIMQAYTLAPAHLWRNPRRCFYDDFTVLRKPYGVTLLPAVSPVLNEQDGGAWVDPGADWGTAVIPNSQYTPPGVRSLDTYAYAHGGASPVPALVNVGSADMVAGCQANEPTSSTLTYPTAGGGGVVFRSNSSGTSYWRAFANRTSGKIHLWNTTDGAVGTPFTYSIAKGIQPEIEVRCQGNRIRVYVDCLPEPVIDTTSTRFNNNTYAGIQVVADTTPGHSYQFRKVYGQGL